MISPELLTARSLKKTENQPILSISPKCFDAKTQTWASAPPNHFTTNSLDSKNLKLLSFNIMKEKDFLAERMATLLALIEQTDADFICLQENTKRHMALLQSSGLFLLNRELIYLDTVYKYSKLMMETSHQN